MPRHKRISEIEWESRDWEDTTYGTFEYLTRNQMVAAEYEYTNKPKYCTGTIFEATASGDKFMSIVTCWSVTYSKGYGRHRVYNKYTKLFRLNKKGEDYIKSLIVEQHL